VLSRVKSQWAVEISALSDELWKEEKAKVIDLYRDYRGEKL